MHACRIGTIDLACRIGIHQRICCRTTDGSTWKKLHRYIYVLDFHGILCLKDCKGKLLVFGHHGSHWIYWISSTPCRLCNCTYQGGINCHHLLACGMIFFRESFFALPGCLPLLWSSSTKLATASRDRERANRSKQHRCSRGGKTMVPWPPPADLIPSKLNC